MKLLKILFFCIILFIILFSNVYATESQEDLSDNLEVLSSMFSNTNNVDEEDLATTDTSIPTISSQVVTTTSDSENVGLSTSDIINIILIAVGLVLIFLAVAILLRSK